MPSWRGDNSNPVPNFVQEADNRSEKNFSVNRAEQIRRDKDAQKNFTISLMDIDEAILYHLNNLQLQVVDVGKKIQVPTFFGSPEQWASLQKYGYIRDKQGKLILPAIILKRITSENDKSLQFFNRYLDTPAIKLYSEKNKYTQFSLLTGKNTPVHEVYNIIVPSHMLLTYHFIIWTEYVEQMNVLVENFQFNTKDYWGSRKGFRFRTRIESFGHTVELQTGEDRVVRTEFDLTTHGYVLPDSIVKLEDRELTTKKFFTPKKVIITSEIVMSVAQLNKDREKWRNQNYPNIQKDIPIPPPPIVVDGFLTGNIKTNLEPAIPILTWDRDNIEWNLDNTNWEL
jgi:hypothetical protein